MAVFRFETKKEEDKIEQTPIKEAKEVKKPTAKKVAKSPKSSVPEGDAIHAKKPKAVKVTKAKESKK
tara:strand:- start:4 stop:204 length:201 start_codon:yes stop_codon:yes gene_type:complete